MIFSENRCRLFRIMPNASGGLALERKLLAAVETANRRAVEARVFDLDIGAEQGRIRQLLDREADRFRSRRKTPIGHLAIGLAAAAREQLGGSTVVESGTHRTSKTARRPSKP